VVGFDVRNEAYICWRSDQEGNFDTSDTILVDRMKAHNATREFDVTGRLPPLPPLDHTGRIMDRNIPVAPRSARSPIELRPSNDTRTPIESPRRKEKDGVEPAGTPLLGNRSSRTSTSMVPSTASTMASTMASTPHNEPVTPAFFTRQPSAPSGLVSPSDGLPTPSVSGHIDAGKELGYEDMKTCAVCSLLRALALVLSKGLQSTAAVLRYAAGPRARPMPGPGNVKEDEGYVQVNGAWKWSPKPKTVPDQDAVLQGSRSCGSIPRLSEGASSSSEKHFRPFTRQTSLPQQADSSERLRCSDLQITIPVVKPPGWQEVQPVVHQMPVTFDERGVKEAMTVKQQHWPSFVERQRAKLQKEVAKAKFQTVDDDYDDYEIDEDQVQELEQMISSMEDWKDLTHYCGKSVGMASTRRGNVMKLHVVAFAQRDDGLGIDFMRVCYKKSVEVQDRPADESYPLLGVHRAIRCILPMVIGPEEAHRKVEEKWLSLLQRPDVAKYAIALAFAGALQLDGVNIQFCDGGLTDTPEEATP